MDGHERGRDCQDDRAFHPKNRIHVRWGALLTHYRPAMPFGNKKNILEDLFSSVLPIFLKISPLLKPEIQ